MCVSEPQAKHTFKHLPHHILLVEFRASIIKQFSRISEFQNCIPNSVQCLPFAIWAAPSILAKNFSIGTDEFKPYHFRTRETKDKFLRNVGGPSERRYFDCCISALDSSNSVLNRASAILNFKLCTNSIPKRSSFKSDWCLLKFLKQ